MKLEDQVCSLEMAKRLKELGVKQGSTFFWNGWHELHGQVYPHSVVLETKSRDGERDTYFQSALQGDGNDIAWTAFSAFSVCELGEMMPGKIQTERYNGDKWSVFWMSEPMTEHSKTAKTAAQTEADARAKMLIYLLENGLVAADKILHQDSESGRIGQSEV